MALPSVVKTYTFDLNNQVAADGGFTPSADGLQPTNDRKQTLLEVKDSLVASGAWSVKLSSDSSTAGAGDNWSTIADLFYRREDLSGVFSWIVLANTTMDVEIYIGLETENGTEGGEWRVIASRPTLSGGSGFTGGTTTARPTASDEQVLADPTFTLGQPGWGHNDPVGRDWVWHTMVSDDDEVTRVLICRDSEVRCWWFVERIQNPVSGMSSPELAMAFRPGTTNSNTAGLATCLHTQYMDGVGPSGSHYVGSSPLLLSDGFINYGPWFYLTGEGFSNDALGQNFAVANQVDGNWDFSPVGLASLTPGFIGRHGEMFDMWWGSEAVNTGDTYPSDSSRQFVQFGDLIFPWDGSVPVIA